MHLATLKSQLDIVQVVEGAGLDLHGRGNVLRALCPWHEDVQPSLVVWPSTQSWRCFSCQYGGDAIDFIQRLHQCSLKDAVERIQQGTLSFPIVRVPPKKVPPPTIDGNNVEMWHKNLLQNEKALNWCENQRFWSLEAIKKLKIGLNLQNRRLTIPIPSVSNSHWVDVRQYNSRLKPKMLPYAEGTTASPLDVGGMNNETWCVLVEGEPDAIALASLSIPAATNTNGCQSAAAIWSVWGGIVLASRVLICYDADEAGRSAAHKVLSCFPGRGKIVSLPESVLGKGGDITDAIQHYGATVVKEALFKHVTDK